MPSWVVKLADDCYCEWSTVVDAPISEAVSRVEAVRLFDRSDGGRNDGLAGEARVARADAHITSCIIPALWPDSIEEFVAGNRAGPDETELSLPEIIRSVRRVP